MIELIDRLKLKRDIFGNRLTRTTQIDPRHSFRFRVSELLFGKRAQLPDRGTHSSQDNVVTWDCLSYYGGSSPCAEKLTSCTRKFNGGLPRNSRGFRTYVHLTLPPFPPLALLSLSLTNTRIYAHTDSVRHERFGASLGKLAREETSVPVAKLRLFCLAVLPSRSPLRLVAPSSRHPSELATHPPFAPLSSNLANYPSPGTLILRVQRRTRQEERDLNVFGRRKDAISLAAKG